MDLFVSLFGKIEEIGEVTIADVCLFTHLSQAVQGKLLDRHQHAEARVVLEVRCTLQQAFIHQ
jgi:hypothetical protein